MSKEQKYIEDLFRSELADYSIETNESDWTAIMEKYNADTRRRKGFFWFIKDRRKNGLVLWFLASSVAVLSVVGGYNIFGGKDANSTLVQNDPVRATESHTASDIDKKLKNTTSSSSASRSNETLTSIDNESGLNRPPDAVDPYTDPSSASSSAGVSTQSSTRVEFDGVIRDGGSDKGQKIDGSIANTGKNTKLERPETFENDQEAGDQLIADASGTDQDPSTDGTNEVAASDETADEINNDAVSAEDQIADVTSTDAAEDQEADAGSAQDDPLTIPELVSPWRVELTTSFLNSGSFISSPNDQYKTLRQNSESGMLSMASGLRLYYHSNKQFFGTGIGMATFRQDASYNYTRTIYDLVPVKDPGGDTIGFFKTNFRDTASKFGSENIIKTTRIPLIYGYEHGDLKSGYRLKGVFVTDYVTTVSGSTVEDEELSPVQLNSVVKEGTFKFGLMGEFGYYRQIADRFSVELNGGIGTSLSNFRKGSGSSEDRIWSYSIGIGLSYKL